MVWLTFRQALMLCRLARADRKDGAEAYMRKKWFRFEKSAGFERVGISVPLEDEFPKEISDLRALHRKWLLTNVPGGITPDGREWFRRRFWTFITWVAAAMLAASISWGVQACISSAMSGAAAQPANQQQQKTA